jgi:hypothetical protein
MTANAGPQQPIKVNTGLKHAYEQLYACFFFSFYLLALKMHVQAIIHAFLMFFFFHFLFSEKMARPGIEPRTL